MAAVLKTLAESVVEEINTDPLTFDGQPVNATRVYVPVKKQSELASLCVQVVPFSLESRVVSRSQTAEEYHVAVLVQKRIDRSSKDTELAAIDALVEFVEQLAAKVSFIQVGGFTWIETEFTAFPYLDEHLEQLNCYTAVLTLTFKGKG